MTKAEEHESSDEDKNWVRPKKKQRQEKLKIIWLPEEEAVVARLFKDQITRVKKISKQDTERKGEISGPFANSTK